MHECPYRAWRPEPLLNHKVRICQREWPSRDQTVKKTWVPTKKRDGMVVWGCEIGLREVELCFGRDLQILRQVYHGQFQNPEFLRPRAGCACYPEEKGHSTELATA